MEKFFERKNFLFWEMTRETLIFREHEVEGSSSRCAVIIDSCTTFRCCSALDLPWPVSQDVRPSILHNAFEEFTVSWNILILSRNVSVRRANENANREPPPHEKTCNSVPSRADTESNDTTSPYGIRIPSRSSEMKLIRGRNGGNPLLRSVDARRF